MNRPILSIICGMVQIMGLVLMVLFLDNKDSNWYLLLLFVFGLAPIIKLLDQNTRKHFIGIPAAICGLGVTVLSLSTLLIR